MNAYHVPGPVLGARIQRCDSLLEKASVRKSISQGMLGKMTVEIYKKITSIRMVGGWKGLE